MNKLSLFLFASSLLFSKISACTGIIKKAEDGSSVYARTMEFGADFLSFDLLFVPKGTASQSLANKKDEGSKWTTKYAYVGFNPFEMPIVVDGINDQGLAGGGFYFPGWAEYQKVSDEEASKAISNLDFISWALGNFSTVNEVREALKTTKVIGVIYGPWGIVPPLHYVLADKSGDMAVIEYVKGQLQIYKMPIETVTNAPLYEWHLLNARNYIGLRALNSPSVAINGDELSQFGQGSGAIGLPGDFTPPSRLIRAAFLNQVVAKAKDPIGNIQRAFKILNQFDIPRGAVREQLNGKEILEETQWTSAADLTGLKYYFHTAKNRAIRTVDLNSLSANISKAKSIPINDPEKIEDISGLFKE